MKEKQPETYFRIRRIKDGLFSTGGIDPDWSKKGKIWKGIGPLKLHLLQVDWSSTETEPGQMYCNDEVEIVEYVMTEKCVWLLKPFCKSFEKIRK